MRSIQQTIQSLLTQLTEEGKERGVQVAAYLDGSLIVDASAGVADAATGRLVDGETLFPVFSTGKGVTATLAHLLVERGQITYDTPIADCWPEFAAHGKEKITLRHALNHTAGLYNMPRGLSHAQLHDWEAMCAAVAEMTPSHPPGMEMVYHAVTYSWTVGEVLRRIDGRSFQKMLEAEICKPLGLTGMFIGIPDEVEPRVAILEEEVDPTAVQSAQDDTTDHAVPHMVEPLYAWMNRPDARRACIPASNGIMNARSIARHYAALLPGGVDGVELLPPERVRLATELQRPTNGRPGDPVSWGLGYAMGSHTSEMAFGHGGFGGSAGFADPEHRLSFGFTLNRFGTESPIPKIVAALQDAMGVA